MGGLKVSHALASTAQLLRALEVIESHSRVIKNRQSGSLPDSCFAALRSVAARSMNSTRASCVGASSHRGPAHCHTSHHLSISHDIYTRSSHVVTTLESNRVYWFSSERVAVIIKGVD